MHFQRRRPNSERGNGDSNAILRIFNGAGSLSMGRRSVDAEVGRNTLPE